MPMEASRRMGYEFEMTTNFYSDFLVALAQAKIKFVVAGGVAAVLHGVERVTGDNAPSGERYP